MASRASRLALAFGALALVSGSLPAQAQFSGILGSGKRGADKADACGKGKKGDKGRGVLGGILSDGLIRRGHSLTVARKFWYSSTSCRDGTAI